MKKLIKYFIVITLILVEGFLLISFVGEDAKERKEVEKFCDQNCEYNKNSYLWEFVGENISRGFTTKDECTDYCIDYKQGFVYTSLLDAKNFLSSLMRR